LVTLYQFHCDPLLYTTALEGSLEITISLNMQAMNLKCSGKVTVSTLRYCDGFAQSSARQRSCKRARYSRREVFSMWSAPRNSISTFSVWSALRNSRKAVFSAWSVPLLYNGTLLVALMSTESRTTRLEIELEIWVEFRE
jgi:hypothetical protein